MTNAKLERLLRRRTALEERSRNMDEEATSTALAECGPKRNDPAWQAAFDVTKRTAFTRGNAQVETELAAVNTEISVLRGEHVPNQTTDQEKKIDITRLQNEAIALTLTSKKDQEQGTAPTQESSKQTQKPGPAKDFDYERD